MSKTIDIIIPDIGDFDNVPVIEVLIAEGDVVEKDDSMVTLESEKATMEIPAPQSGTVKSVTVKEGDVVAKGQVIGQMEVSETAEEKPAAAKQETATKPASPAKAQPASTPQPETNSQDNGNYDTEMLVIGAGPGGYTAAFRAADLGMKTTLVERYETLGGVCLNVGCIPSKALLHSAGVIREAAHMEKNGISFGKPQIDREKLLGFKNSVVSKLTGGLAQMAKQRKVERATGEAKFIDQHTVSVDGKNITFKHCIIAAGSQVFKLPGMPWDDERLMDSTDALDMTDIPTTPEKKLANSALRGRCHAAGKNEWRASWFSSA